MKHVAILVCVVATVFIGTAHPAWGQQCTSIPLNILCPTPSASPSPVPPSTPEVVPTPTDSPVTEASPDSRDPVRPEVTESGESVEQSDEARGEIVQRKNPTVPQELAFTGPVDPLVPILGFDLVLAGLVLRRRAAAK